jgi:3'-phosphoadenosine 5'-phosphosulfate (PAPS) 3'-phosphatase
MQHIDETVTTARLLSVAVDACKSAGGLLLDYARSGFQIERKNAIDLVTDADHAAEQCIVDHIRAHFPTHSTLAEERGQDAPPASRYQWIIDPLDGTTNFAHRFPVYAVSIGVEWNATNYSPRKPDTARTSTANRSGFPAQPNWTVPLWSLDLRMTFGTQPTIT